MTWYRFRTVHHKLVRGVKSRDDPLVQAVWDQLLEQAEADLLVYFLKHDFAQRITTRFVKPRLDGLEVFCAITLFGPPSMEDEITQELALWGEV